MKRYKLKQWYPSLGKDVEIGIILNYYEGAELYSDHHLDVEALVELEPEEVEGSPDFWELVEDFEILLWRDKSNQKVYRPDSQLNGLFTWGGARVYTVEQLIRDECQPYLVRRLSDSEDFMVGQNILIKDRKCVPMKITSMVLNESGLMIMAHGDNSKADRDVVFGCGARIDQIEQYIDRFKKVLSLDMIEEAWMDGGTSIDDVRSSKLYKKILKKLE